MLQPTISLRSILLVVAWTCFIFHLLSPPPPPFLLVDAFSIQLPVPILTSHQRKVAIPYRSKATLLWLEQPEKSSYQPPSTNASSSPRKGSTSSTSNNGGYRFGDLTRQLIGDRVNQLTGKDQTGQEYEFGDLSRWIDGRIKTRVNSVISGQTDGDNHHLNDASSSSSYQFGDLTKWALSQAKNATSQYTGKDSYQVGDISKEVMRRVRTGEYAVEDVWLALRVLLTAGIGSFTPLASLLPFRLLLNLVNVGLAQEVSGRLLEALAGVLDRRVKQALTGKADYQIGDITKDHLQHAIQQFTGKDTYEIGDISRTIQQLAQQHEQQQGATRENSKVPQIKVHENSLKDLEAWDAKFREKAAASNTN